MSEGNMKNIRLYFLSFQDIMMALIVEIFPRDRQGGLVLPKYSGLSGEFLAWEENEINIMAPGALSPRDANPSATVTLTVQLGGYSLLRAIISATLALLWKNGVKPNTYLCFLKKNRSRVWLLLFCTVFFKPQLICTQMNMYGHTSLVSKK